MTIGVANDGAIERKEAPDWRQGPRPDQRRTVRPFLGVTRQRRGTEL